MKMNGKNLAALFVCFGLIGAACAQENPALFMSRANAKVAKASGRTNRWDLPASGPKIKTKKRIVFIAGDLANPGIYGLSNAVREAISIAGWEMLMIDCRGACNSSTAAVTQATKMKVDGIILAGVDAYLQTKGLEAAAAQKIPVVGWHASAKLGATDGLFSNISTDPKEAAQIAALLGVVDSDGHGGMVILTDSSSVYSATKSTAIVDIIKQCTTCTLLSVEEMPLTTARAKLPELTTTLLKKYGSKWTHTIAVNDLYFDLMATPAITTLLAGTKMQAISAGDGSTTAYQRIHGKKLQIGTVPEPINLQGWLLIDELNRAMSGAQSGGYASQVHLATAQNIAYDGGAKDTFEPDIDYRTQFKKNWLP